MIALRSLIAPALVLATAGGLVYSGWYVGVTSTEKAQLERDSELAKQAQVMREAVAEEVGKIKVESKTYVRNFRTKEKENVVYKECSHPDDVMRLLDSALGGGQQPMPDKLPK